MPAESIPCAAVGSTDRRGVRRIIALLPKGHRLTVRVWERRHRAIVNVAFFQSLIVVAFGLWRGGSPAHVGAEAGAVAAVAALARVSKAAQPYRAAYATLSLVMASAMLVHQSGGVTEWHFHFFVMVGLITLYQEWVP